MCVYTYILVFIVDNWNLKGIELITEFLRGYRVENWIFKGDIIENWILKGI